MPYAPHAEAINKSGILALMQYSNSVTDNIFGIGILAGLYIIIASFLIRKGEYAPDALIVSGFICTMVGIFFYMGSLIVGQHLFLLIMSMILPAVWSYYSKSG